MFNNFGQILPEDAGTGLVTSLTSAISDNIGEILVVMGAMAGVFIVLGLLRRALNRKS